MTRVLFKLEKLRFYYSIKFFDERLKNRNLMSFDLVSQNISLLMRDTKNLSPIIRKDMAAANEKDRSIGNLCEQLADGCIAASNHQRPTVQSALIGFATILSRVELSRKALYQRILPLSSNILVDPSGSTQQVSAVLKKRDLAMKKAQRLPPPNNDPNVAKNNLFRTEANSLNSQALQEARVWQNGYNMNLTKSLREYAHAQMEFAAKALEQWSNFMEDLTLLDFSRDTDEIITMLEEGSTQ